MTNWNKRPKVSSYAATTSRAPLPREIHRRPGDVLHRLAVITGESVEAAMVRARTMPWWRLVRRARPQWARGWWCWTGAPIASRAVIETSSSQIAEKPKTVKRAAYTRVVSMGVDKIRASHVGRPR